MQIISLRMKKNCFTRYRKRLKGPIQARSRLALENARLYEEIKRLHKEVEHRAAEITIINSVQEGLASRLDVQAIYDLAGDKIHDLFKAQITMIQTYDHATQTRQIRYYYEEGQRLDLHVKLPFSKITRHLLSTKKPLVINQLTNELLVNFDIFVFPGTEPMKSGVWVPFMTGNEVSGSISLQSAEHENIFSDSDVNLISTFASTMSIIVENLQLFDQSQQLLKDAEQQAVKLDIINGLQRGLSERLSSGLDMQDMYGFLGDKIREVFPDQDVNIRVYDPKTNLVHLPYYTDGGNRVAAESFLLPDTGITSHVLRTKQALVINEHFVQALQTFGSDLSLLGTHPAKSGVLVPLIVENQALGLIGLNDVKREHAFTRSDVRFLETLANSISSALENARHYDEIQRLLQQRVTELSTINQVHEGLASRLDIQAIYDLVGDQIRQLMDVNTISIISYNIAARIRVINYRYEDGQRFHDSSKGFNKLTEHLIATKRPLVINRRTESLAAEFGLEVNPGSVPLKSAIFVPFLAGNEVKGCITVQNTEQENAFSEADVNLLSAIASSMSITLENIRLFDESQRLLQETEQRATELAIINNVQEGLASKLDVQAIYDLVGDKIRELFNAQTIIIVTFDLVARTRQVNYYFQKGTQGSHHEILAFNKLTEHLIATKETLIIKQLTETIVAEFGLVSLPGTAPMKSGIFVPILAGDEVKGFISIQNVEEENAFSDSIADLLSTFAASMSVALESARLYQEQLEVAKELKRVDRMKTQFLSSMSHELRTPLNAIINFVELIVKGMIGPINPEQQDLLKQTLSSSRHLLHLINDMLDISKIQAGRLTLFLEAEINLQEELEAVLSIVRVLAKEKGLQLFRDIDPHLPPLRCDRRRVRQVLLNLLGNAIKFTQHGSVTLSAKKRQQEVLFAVIDTGPGIPTTKQDLIFEPFIQGGEGDKEIQGTGLGLPISRSLVQAHGGELWVESELGEGTAFFFTLPLRDPKDAS